MAKAVEAAKHASLAAAVCAVMKEVTVVEETGKNAFHNYTYATQADLLRVIQPSMARNGLVLYPSGLQQERIQVADTRAGKPQWITSQIVEYTIEHADSEQERKILVPGSGIDSEDKGPYKGMTGALKYALRQLFLIPTSDDPERDEIQRGITAHPDDDSKLVNTEEARREGREWVIKAHYDKHTADDDWSPQSFAAELKREELPRLDDVRWFCLWLGKKKPSQLDNEGRAKLVAWLKTDGGKERFKSFTDAAGL